MIELLVILVFMITLWGANRLLTTVSASPHAITAVTQATLEAAPQNPQVIKYLLAKPAVADAFTQWHTTWRAANPASLSGLTFTHVPIRLAESLSASIAEEDRGLRLSVNGQQIGKPMKPMNCAVRDCKNTFVNLTISKEATPAHG